MDAQQSRNFARALAKAGTPHQLVIVEGAKHGFHLQPKEKDLRPLVLGFLDQLLKSPAASRSLAAAKKEFRVATFGAKGDGRHDDGPAIQSAIEAAIAAGPGAEVALEAGKNYRLGPNTQELAKLRIGNAHGLTLSGHGAMLVTHPSNRPLSIFDSRDITVHDLALDYDPLPFTQARLTGLALERGAVQFRVEPGYTDPAVGDEQLYRDFKSSDAVFLDDTSRAFTHEWGRLRSIRAIGDHVFEAQFHAPDLRKRFTRLKVGDFIAIKKNFPEAPPRRDREGRFLTAASANIYITFSQNVRLERIISHAAPAMTFVASGAEGVVLDGCKVIRKPGSDRLIASNSDGAHLKSLTVMPQIRNTVFEALMDDSINIKVSSEVVKALQGKRVRLAHGDILTDDLVIEPGQSLTFLGGSTKRYLGQAKVLAVQRIRYREAWITLDREVPGLKADDLAFLRPATEAIVDRCEFRSQLKTALVTHPPSVISDCVFDDVAYGVHAFFTDKIEGPPPMNLRLSRCSFIHPGVSAIALHLPAADSVPPGNRAILAEQCRFIMGNQRGMALTAYNQQGIELRQWEGTTEDARSQTELIRLRGCSGIREEGVVFTGAPRKNQPGPR